MRRFGSTGRFLELLAAVRELAPGAGARSNVIVGFPGETEADVAELERFLTAARLDAVGVFDYSDEEGTEAADLPEKVDAETVRHRYERLCALAEELCAQRAEERVGETIEVLVEAVDGDVEGRAAHKAPEVDESTTLVGDVAGLRTWDLVTAFGKVADPIADKALTGTALVLLSAYGRLPWCVTGLILVREVGVTALRFVVIRRGVIPASRGGKIKTALQIAAISWYLWPVPGYLTAVGPVIMGGAVVITVATGIDYVVRASRLRRR